MIEGGLLELSQCLLRWLRSFVAGWALGVAAAWAGAAESHWAFQPIREVKLPPPREGAAHPIDRFVAARLKERGLRLAPPADRRTLIRRAAYDLKGLPPTPEEVASFLNDSQPGAFERAIEAFLASPQYGERWG